MMPAILEPAQIEGRRGFIRPLDDGTPMFYGPVGPIDRERLRQGLRELSPASRYLRFLSPLDHFDEELIERLITPDQVDHVAWGALNLSEPGAPGLALGRMVREAEDRAAAEIALAVLDRYHGQGVGGILLAILCARARKLGIAELRGWVLPHNHRVIQWFTRLGAAIERQEHEWQVRLAVPGEEVEPESASSLIRLHTLMQQVERVLGES
jgi:GNAT superfamily N-acetyltransferase